MLALRICFEMDVAGHEQGQYAGVSQQPSYIGAWLAALLHYVFETFPFSFCLVSMVGVAAFIRLNVNIHKTAR